MSIKKSFLYLLLLSILLSACGREQVQTEESAAEQLEQLIEKEGIEAADEKFHELKAESSGKYVFNEDEFIFLGYKMRYRGMIRESLEIFRLTVEAFPSSWNAWGSLGEAYIYADNKQEAVKSYKKSLELNPENSNAQWNLDGMDRELYEARNETRATFRFEPGEKTGLMGPYLGQTPPGLEPEIFAPGIVSTRGGHEFSCTFSPDGKEFYYNRGPNIWFSKLEKEGWTVPEPVTFNSPYLDHEPHITHDGRRLYFGSARPRPGIKEGEAYGIWSMEKSDTGWGEPQFHGQGMYVTTTTDGTVYVTDVFEVAGGGICSTRLINRTFTPLERLEGDINAYRSAHPCVAWDESFLIFDSSRPDALGGEGDDDFYICFRREDGSWGKVIHFKEISSLSSNMTASLSPDGKYLFYYSNHDIYWVSTKVIEKLRDIPLLVETK